MDNLTNLFLFFLFFEIFLIIIVRNLKKDFKWLINTEDELPN
jgi:preprotein translocase subunit YajC